MKTQNFWQTANKASVNDFIKLLEFHTLDPIALNYGKYAGMVKKLHYHPEHTPASDVPKINSSFTDLSWHFEGNPTKQEVLKAKKEVNKHLKSEKFQSALLDQFNCVSIELTYFIDPVKLAEYNGKNTSFSGAAFRGDWYGTIKSDLYFPIKNWWNEDFKNEWRRMQQKGEQLKNVSFFELKVSFHEKHFTPSEYDEVIKFNFPKHKTGNGTIIGQARRVKDTSLKLTKYTFKSTGRSILYDANAMYCFTYKEVEPFISQPTKL